MKIVVDASVAIKWFMPEDHSNEAELLLGMSFDLNAPDLAFAEFGNIVWKKWRNGDLSAQECTSIVRSLHQVEMKLHSNELLVESAVSLAIETHQSVYDCTYLALAIALNCQMATADRRFFIGLRKTRYKDRVIWIENIPSNA